MKYLAPVLLLCACVAGCSSEKSNQADTTNVTTSIPSATAAVPGQPAEVKSVATSNDALLMAEYLVFTHLTDSLIYRPMNDTAAMFRLVSGLDMTAPNYGTNMTHATFKYLHSICSNAQLPLQQYAGSVRTPEIKRMADDFNNQLQQMTNQYTRALAILEQGGNDAARAEQMQQVAMLVQGNTMASARRHFDEGSRSAFAAAHRVLGR